MLERFARLAVAWPKTVVVVALALLIAALGYGHDVTDRLAGGGYWSASSESWRAGDLLQHSGEGDPEQRVERLP